MFLAQKSIEQVQNCNFGITYWWFFNEFA